jgi:hypothetical protein
MMRRDLNAQQVAALIKLADAAELFHVGDKSYADHECLSVTSDRHRATYSN